MTAKRKSPGTVRVELRMPKALVADLRSRVKGTSVRLDHYVNALLMVQVVGMINAGREDDRRWNEHQRERQRFVFCTCTVGASNPHDGCELHGTQAPTISFPAVDQRTTKDFPPKAPLA